MAKEQRPPKKGSHRMATVYKPESGQEIADQQLDSEIGSFVQKLHGTIQDARSKMTDEELAEADKKAKAILDRATSAAKASRHTA
jgi:hypothetical protein